MQLLISINNPKNWTPSDFPAFYIFSVFLDLRISFWLLQFWLTEVFLWKSPIFWISESAFPIVQSFEFSIEFLHWINPLGETVATKDLNRLKFEYRNTYYPKAYNLAWSSCQMDLFSPSVFF